MSRFPLFRSTPGRPKNIFFFPCLHKILAFGLVALLCSSSLSFGVLAHQGQPGGGFVLPLLAESSNSIEETTEGSGFIINQVNGQTVCRNATPAEMRRMNQRNPNQKLHPINHPEIFKPLRRGYISPDESTDSGSQNIDSEGQGGETAPGTSTALEASAGLTIILRATAQLEANPAAKNAFIRAANHWEAIIQTPITIIIDVDYGTTRFGDAWDSPNTLGSTDGGSVPVISFQQLSQALNSGKSNPDETALYAELVKATALPTDLSTSNVTDIIIDRSLARALGFRAPDARSDASSVEQPSIGFNSSFTFDFDPSDGVTAHQTDFDSVVTHEIGHVLGFMSAAGMGQITLSSPNGPSRQAYVASPWDVFRFKPSSAPSLTNFSTLARTLTVGTSNTDLQVEFLGTNLPQPGLSTGGPDGKLGDKHQSSHWRADENGGTYFGIMDPTIAATQHYTITDNDKRTLDFMGYQVVGISSPAPAPPPPTIINLTSGQSTSSTVDAPPSGGFTLSQTQYAIQVPSGATQLTINLSGNPDVDLHVRRNSPVALSGTIIVDDVRSDGPTGSESITLAPTSMPALASGTYYIAIANYGPGGANFTLTATVTSPTLVVAPKLFIEEGTINDPVAVAFDSVTQSRGPFSVTGLFNFSADRHTRVMLFTSNLGSDLSGLSVQAQGVPLLVESVGTVPGVSNASSIIVRLPDELLPGTLLLSVTLRGSTSNMAKITIVP
ncbi:MAG: hypothetical protein QOH25_1127 [Acidobacteriota bacterium]|jgi:hypothetical protein|nr:hypothetical protein [Acidobacteriota bacterium]